MVAFVHALAVRTSEVALFLEVITGSDPADAAWAFERLKDVGDDSLPDLAGRADDPARTLLHDLHWHGSSLGASTGFRTEPFRVGQVARFVLACRWRLPRSWMFHDWEAGEQHPTAAEWAEALARFERTAADPDGFPIEPHPSSRSFLRAPDVSPPSRDRELAALFGRRDAGGLLEVLRSRERPEAAWALEGLRGLSDEELDRIAPSMESAAPTAVRHLCHRTGSASRDRFTTGQVVRFLLWERLGLVEPGAWSEEPPPAGAVEALRLAWKEYQAARPQR